MSVQCSECQCGRKQVGVKGRSNRDPLLKVRSRWLECSMNRVSDGDRFHLLSFVSCGALQSDEIIGILKVLFRYMGIGTRLAMCSVIWMRRGSSRSWCPTQSPFYARASLVTVVSQDTPPQVADCAAILVSSFVTRRHSTISPFCVLKPVRGRASFIICQDKTRLVEFPLRAGIGARCVRAEGSRSLA